MRRIDYIIESKFPPQKHVLWLYNGDLKYYRNGEWITIVSDIGDIEAEILKSVAKELLDYIKKEEAYDLFVSAADLDKVIAELAEQKESVETLSTNLTNKVDKEEGKSLSSNDYTTGEKNKLAGIAVGANKVVIDSVLNNTSTNPVQNKVLNNAFTANNQDHNGFNTAIENLIQNKVDKEDGLALSSNDYTDADKEKLSGIESGANKYTHPSAHSLDMIIETTSKKVMTADERTKLDGIDIGANKTIVDDTIDENSTNPLQNKVIYNSLAEATITLNTSIEKKLDSTISRAKKTFYAAPVDADGVPSFRAITTDDLPDSLQANLLDMVSYGVSWKTSSSDPALTRVGNMTYHKTLPIQSGMKGCIVKMKDGVSIQYYLDPDDWRWREPNNAAANIATGTMTGNSSGLLTVESTVFSTRRYINQWVKVTDYYGATYVGKVTDITTSSNTAVIDTTVEDSASVVSNSEPGISLTAVEPGGTSVTLEMGAVLNGYDGEVMVYVPEFWIKSWDGDTEKEVRISTLKIDDTWEHQPAILVSPYHLTQLNTVPSDMSYLSTLTVNSLISVCSTESYVRGGNNRSAFDTYLSTNVFKTDLGKARGGLSTTNARTYVRLTNKELLNYEQYKRIFYWLYVIEYANFNAQLDYNSSLTSEGYHQGGIGKSVTNITYANGNSLNNCTSIVPIGYTNTIGNGTGVINASIVCSDTVTVSVSIPRWRGIELPFGNLTTRLDGIIVIGNSVKEGNNNYSEVYTTEDPNNYSTSDYSKMTYKGLALHSSASTIKEFTLGSTADIFQKETGGSVTTYKCDGTAYRSDNAGKARSFRVGGYFYSGDWSGLAFQCIYALPDEAAAWTGYRAVCSL